MEGAILATQSAAIQHQINYTRASEFEADRIGIGTMASAGYDPLGMASFFDYMIAQRTGTEPRQRRAIPDRSPDIFRSRRRGAQSRGTDRAHPSRRFAGLHADARALAVAGRAIRRPRASTTPTSLKNGGGQQHRGALRQGRRGHRDPQSGRRPFPICRNCVHEYPKVTQFYGALGQAYLANGQLKESQAILEQAMTLFPRNVPITIRLAETLDARRRQQARASASWTICSIVVEPTPDQTRLIAKAANAAGDVADSYYYMSDFYLMSGDLEDGRRTNCSLALACPDWTRYSAHASARGSKKCARRCPKTGRTRSPTTTATAGIATRRRRPAVSQRSTRVSFGHQ